MVHTTNTRGGGRLYYPHLATSTTDIKPDSAPLPLANRVAHFIINSFLFLGFVTQSNLFLKKKKKRTNKKKIIA